MKTQIISLYGGPGTGKSTSAAALFATLKRRGVNAELVQEYVKEKCWENHTFTKYDQFTFIGEQIAREVRLLGKVNVVVTDSPVWVSAFYAWKHAPSDISYACDASASAYYQNVLYDGHYHHHVYLKRTKTFNPLGRIHTEQESLEIDVEQRTFVESRVSYLEECTTEPADLDALLQRMIK